MYDATAETAQDVALRALLAHLAAEGYSFTTPTPGTVSLVRDRRDATTGDVLRDVFGWTRRFTADRLDPHLLGLLQGAGLVERDGDHLRSRVRVSTVDGRLFAHTAPSAAKDAVFLGPDSYRYARLLKSALGDASFQTALDLGTGAGVGALTLAALRPDATVLASDINPTALTYARLNAEAAALTLTTVRCDGVPQTPTTFDVIAANPPYIAGDGGRIYRDGGDQLGAGLALSWLRAGLPRLRPGGRFVLYTGSAIAAGRDFIRDECRQLADTHRCGLSYDEIDPDVFGSTLRQAAYAEVERIAAVGVVFTAEG